MNWIGIVVGAGAGVVAVLISAGIMRLLGKSKFKGANVLNGLIFVAALALGREFVTPRIQAQQVESKLLEMPIYRALQQHEPEAYSKILSAIEHGIANKLPQERMWAVGRPEIAKITERRMPHATDEVVIKFSQHLVTSIGVLHSKGGNACFSYTNPAPGEFLDFTALLGKEVAQQELNLVAELVVSTAGKKRAAVTAAEVTSDLEFVIGKLLTKYSNEDMATLENPLAPGVDKRKYCELIVDLFKEAIALPSPRNNRLLRYLMQG